jgi:Leucine-rich repeat (LRR) protein
MAQASASSKHSTSRVTFDLLARLHVDSDVLERRDHEQIAEQLLQCTHIRLASLGLRELDNFECLGRVTHLYINDNVLSSLEGIEVLVHLRVIHAADNKLTDVSPLSFLRELTWLDLSRNALTHANVSQLPPSVIFLFLAGNPCAESQDLR